MNHYLLNTPTYELVQPSTEILLSIDHSSQRTEGFDDCTRYW